MSDLTINDFSEPWIVYWQRIYLNADQLTTCSYTGMQIRANPATQLAHLFEIFGACYFAHTLSHSCFLRLFYINQVDGNETWSRSKKPSNFWPHADSHCSHIYKPASLLNYVPQLTFAINLASFTPLAQTFGSHQSSSMCGCVQLERTTGAEYVQKATQNLS